MLIISNHLLAKAPVTIRCYTRTKKLTHTHTHTHTHNTDGGHHVLVQLSTVSSCACWLSSWHTGVHLGGMRASPNILTHHSMKRLVCKCVCMCVCEWVCVCVCVWVSWSYLQRFPKYFTGYFPNEESFSLLLLVTHPPLPALERAPPPPLARESEGWVVAAFVSY